MTTWTRVPTSFDCFVGRESARREEESRPGHGTAQYMTRVAGGAPAGTCRWWNRFPRPLLLGSMAAVSPPRGRFCEVRRRTRYARVVDAAAAFASESGHLASSRPLSRDMSANYPRRLLRDVLAAASPSKCHASTFVKSGRNSRRAAACLTWASSKNRIRSISCTRHKYGALRMQSRRPAASRLAHKISAARFKKTSAALEQSSAPIKEEILVLIG